jgi:hypothetical protein
VAQLQIVLCIGSLREGKGVVSKIGTNTRYAFYSVDTVKTRLQGQPLNRGTIKYHTMAQSYKLIFKEEGILRGLYAGITPALLGSGK